MAAKGKSPTLTNADVSMPTLPATYLSRVNEEIQALWSMANQPRGILLNGNHVISQENYDTAQTGITATSDFATDQWIVSLAGAAAVTHQRVNSSGTSIPGGYIYALRTQITTIDNSLAAADVVQVFQPVEGMRAYPLSFGNSEAKRLLAGFWVRSSVTGTFGFSLRNAAQNRAYVSTFTINAANTWEFKVVDIPGDTSGTWIGANNSVAMYAGFCLAAGSNFHGTNNTWNAANNLTTSSQTNLAATLNATFDFTGVQIIPADAASLFDATTLSARWSTLFRTYAEEWELCKRYYQKTFPPSTLPAQNAGQPGCWIFQQGFGATAANNTGPGYEFKPRMRASPTVTTFNPSAANAQVRNLTRANDASALAIDSADEARLQIRYTTSAGSAAGDGQALQLTADARMT